MSREQLPNLDAATDSNDGLIVDPNAKPTPEQMQTALEITTKVGGLLDSEYGSTDPSQWKKSKDGWTIGRDMPIRSRKEPSYANFETGQYGVTRQYIGEGLDGGNTPFVYFQEITKVIPKGETKHDFLSHTTIIYPDGRAKYGHIVAEALLTESEPLGEVELLRRDLDAATNKLSRDRAA